ncbi:glycosyltransferase [Halomonas heilongjiangensis]|uniref:Glycosyltransferase 2-like domain-containing protein n=1 Tax=Halomonas heilongjiangensis TaxID=1387883 RepID=A0A2N7TLR1_9GAMM|nr:glycosyltransferase [Halomonas heilongjiangensis]PMR69119.1 hypothetical protein C1H66_12060 [Halomonas heilongjiangensis]PXX94145.1 hypothetical protein CR158_02210 [Halomonas heilongjiangensis]
MFACSIFLDARATGTVLPRRLAALHKLLKGRDGRIELLLVDDTGDPRLPGLASRFGARLLPREDGPLGDRLNAAVARSQGAVLVFLASALPLPADWLDAVAEGLEHHRWDVLVLPARPRGPAPRLWRWLSRSSPADTLCVAREWFDRIGGFDPSLDAKALPELLERLHACQARVQYR